MSHLLVDITAHGYGHIAQTAPVAYGSRGDGPEQLYLVEWLRTELFGKLLAVF